MLLGQFSRRERLRVSLLKGKSLTRDGSIMVGGVDPFKEGLEGVTYLGTGKSKLDFLRNLNFTPPLPPGYVIGTQFH